MIDKLHETKMDRFHAPSGLKFPNMEELIRMQDNAMQLMTIAV